MRPAGRGKLESLYFEYPEFASVTVPELDGERPIHPVAIVGAGPIGLTVALTLAKYGIRSVLLESKNTFNDGSRAICIARPSCHILERIGAWERFEERPLGWRYGSSYFAGREIYRLEMPHSAHEKFLPMYNLQQQYIEKHLWEAAAESDLIEIRWESEVTGVENEDDDATLHVKTPLGAYKMAATYVLAADGARSAMRSMLGLRLQGENFEGNYVIADVRMDHDYPTERRALFAPESNPRGTVLIHKQPDDIWRIDYQLQAGEDRSVAVEEATIRNRVGAILRDIGHNGSWELEWWSIYTANTLCLDEYKHGRVIFIGDSAHIVPIFGVRGLNNGLADAYNVGWKLSYVLNGDADASLLDTYSPERRGATLDVFANASKSARFMTPPTRGSSLVRDAVLSLALRHEFVRPFINPRQMEAYAYLDGQSDIVRRRDTEFAEGPRAGSVCPNVRLKDGSYFLDEIGPGFTGILFADEPEAKTPLFTELDGLDPRFTALSVADEDVTRAFGAAPGAFYLLRPDLHIAGRWLRNEPNEIVHVMKCALGKDLR